MIRWKDNAPPPNPVNDIWKHPKHALDISFISINPKLCNVLLSCILGILDKSSPGFAVSYHIMQLKYLWKEAEHTRTTDCQLHAIKGKKSGIWDSHNNTDFIHLLLWFYHPKGKDRQGVTLFKALYYYVKLFTVLVITFFSPVSSKLPYATILIFINVTFYINVTKKLFSFELEGR